MPEDFPTFFPYFVADFVTPNFCIAKETKETQKKQFEREIDFCTALSRSKRDDSLADTAREIYESELKNVADLAFVVIMRDNKSVFSSNIYVPVFPQSSVFSGKGFPVRKDFARINFVLQANGVDDFFYAVRDIEVVEREYDLYSDTEDLSLYSRKRLDNAIEKYKRDDEEIRSDFFQPALGSTAKNLQRDSDALDDLLDDLASRPDSVETPKKILDFVYGEAGHYSGTRAQVDFGVEFVMQGLSELLASTKSKELPVLEISAVSSFCNAPLEDLKLEVYTKTFAYHRQRVLRCIKNCAILNGFEDGIAWKELG